MFLVKILTKLLSGKNSFRTTLIIVSSGTAIIIPVIPKRNPPIKIAKKISSGCELTLFEKIIGCETLL